MCPAVRSARAEWPACAETHGYWLLSEPLPALQSVHAESKTENKTDVLNSDQMNSEDITTCMIAPQSTIYPIINNF